MIDQTRYAAVINGHRRRQKIKRVVSFVSFVLVYFMIGFFLHATLYFMGYVP